MKIIFDIGANKGQNFKYFFKKADIVIAFEANIILVEKIRLDFKEFIDNKKLVIENIALNDDEKIEKIDFFISKTDDVKSTLYPHDKNKFYKKEVKCKKASSLIKKYLQKYDISEIEYIKIDIEGADKLILRDLLQNNILAKNLSVECQDPEVIELLLKSPYKSFKFFKGKDMTFKKNIEITTKNNNKKIINFDKESSGPFGDDIPGNYYDKNSILPYFLNNGLGWIDTHCSYEKKNNLQTIKDVHKINQTGFKYHLKNILPSLIKSLKQRILKILIKFKFSITNHR